MYDAVVVGSGPNGMAAAISLALAGKSVVVYESSDKSGGGLRSESLTLPGFTHDVFSACHPMAVASPFFRSLPLEKFGLKWIHSPVVFSHCLSQEKSVGLYRSVEETAEHLNVDSRAYENFFRPFVLNAETLLEEIFKPIFHFPKSPFLLAKFGINALMSAEGFAKRHFFSNEARGLFAGVAAHGSNGLKSFASAGPGLALTLVGHAHGWPIPEGGAGQLALALERYFKSLGGEIKLQHRVTNLKDLPDSKVVFFDLTPKQILDIMKSELPEQIQKQFLKFKYGCGAFKMDWAMSGPIPWTSKMCSESITVHLGGTFEDISLSEDQVLKGRASDAPYVLICQPSLFDKARAPENSHVVWGYCHVPNGSTVDMTEVIENQIEKMAPGFKKLILKRSVLNPENLEKRNSNLVGGDISGGVMGDSQFFFRPTGRLSPYALDGIRHWICSSSTPPGPGVHGMSGFNAVKAALKTFK